MNVIYLEREKNVDLAYKARLEELARAWSSEFPNKKLKSFFDKSSIYWLKKQNVNIEFFKDFAVLKNDFKYKNVDEHYTIIPLKRYFSNNQLFIFVSKFLKKLNYSSFAFVKKKSGSINYPHFHLLIWK
ncbi:MAG: hypothetical protein NZZ41_04240 [Candidatus Dojkabacteria bacterium]|nr:hypothetical protein [Candidatus Dojkabacteria bacterium]